MNNASRLALIPARGGSKGIVRKNLALVGGLTLLERAISFAIDSKLFDQICVSTDDQEIADVAKRAGAEVPFLRPQELSKDSSLSLDVIKHAIEFYCSQGKTFTNLTLLQPTTPFRNLTDLESAIETFEGNNCGSLISVFDVTKIHESLLYLPTRKIGSKGWQLQSKAQTGAYVAGSRRQDFPRQFLRNGSIYMFHPENVRNSHLLLTPPIVSIEMDFLRSMNIDDPQDLDHARWVASVLNL